MTKRDYELSASDLACAAVKDVYGYVSHGFGDPCFKITRIEFVDGRTANVEGEHDMPYICDDGKVVKLPESVAD